MEAKKERFKFPKWTVTAFTILLLIVLFITIWLNATRENWQFGRTLIITEVIALAVQILLNIFNWRSQNKIIILATLFVSAAIVASVIWRFIWLNLLHG